MLRGRESFSTGYLSFMLNVRSFTKNCVMSVAEIKNSLHRMIVETDDPDTLESLMIYFASLKEEQGSWNTLPEMERNLVEKGLEDLKAGKTKTNEEVRTRAENLIGL